MKHIPLFKRKEEVYFNYSKKPESDDSGLQYSRKEKEGLCRSLYVTPAEARIGESCENAASRGTSSHMSENTIYNLRLEISQSNGTTWSWWCYPFIDLCCCHNVVASDQSCDSTRNL